MQSKRRIGPPPLQMSRYVEVYLIMTKRIAYRQRLAKIPSIYVFWGPLFLGDATLIHPEGKTDIRNTI